MRLNTTSIGAALALGGALATGMAQAGEREAVRRGVAGAAGHAWTQPAHAVAVVAHGQRAYLPPTRRDLDGDGIPNHLDRLHNPSWDRDGDGIPNHRDRLHNPPWDRDGDGIANRYDRLHNPPWDRDGDGIANRHDRLHNPPRDRDGDGVPNRHNRYDGRQGGGHGRHAAPGQQRRS